MQLAKAKDQLLPLLVMDVLGNIPGLPGVFVAGIFSAALRYVNTFYYVIRNTRVRLSTVSKKLYDYCSSLSTSLNSMSAVVLEDFYKPFFKKNLSERQTNWLLRSVVILLGVLSLG